MIIFVTTTHQSRMDLKSHDKTNHKHLITNQSIPIVLHYNNNNNSVNSDRKYSKKSEREIKFSRNVPKLVQIQFAQFLNSLIEYSSELTYFSINAFQTSSLRRVQMNTLVN